GSSVGATSTTAAPARNSAWAGVVQLRSPITARCRANHFTVAPHCLLEEIRDEVGEESDERSTRLQCGVRLLGGLVRRQALRGALPADRHLINTRRLLGRRRIAGTTASRNENAYK